MKEGREREQDLERFGFDGSGEAWFGFVQEAKLPPDLGSLGPYDLIREVGRGGQGVVFLARDRRTGREVALKRLLAGSFATSDMRRRFEREVEAASALDHPNLVRVHGVEQVGGEPVLVMEWVEGVPIARWAWSGGRRRSLDEILRLFASLCEAVIHAHQRGLIHRDLKPSNVLVDAHDVPHVLDFGLAKWLVRHPGREGSGTAGFVGTPAYAAPEQLRPEERLADVRTDVYSLGVVLYELLTACLPYSLGGNLADALLAIEHVEPTPLRRHDPALAGDLETIVCKALAKEKAHRYASIEALAEDLRRFRTHRAILAHPPSAWYLLRKLVRRRWLPLAAAASALAFVLGFALMKSVHAGHLRQALDKAELGAAFLEELLSAPGPSTEIVRLDYLDGAVRRMEQVFRDHPDVRTKLRAPIALAYLGLAQAGDAERQVRQALTELESRELETSLEYADDLRILGQVLIWQRRNAEAVQVLRRALERHESLLGPEAGGWARTLRVLAQPLAIVGEHAEAEVAARRALAIDEALFGPDSAEVADGFHVLGFVDLMSGDTERALVNLRESLARTRRCLGESSTNAAYILKRLGVCHKQRGELEAAEACFVEAVAILRQRLGRDHPTFVRNLSELAEVRLERQALDEAEELLQEALEIGRQVPRARQAFTASLLARLAEARAQRQEVDAADGLLRDSLEIALAELACLETSPSGTGFDLREDTGWSPDDKERFQTLLEKLRDLRGRVSAPDHPDVSVCQQALVRFSVLMP